MKKFERNSLYIIIIFLCFILSRPVLSQATTQDNESFYKDGLTASDTESAADLSGSEEDGQRYIVRFRNNSDKSVILGSQSEIIQDYKNIPAMAVSLQEEELEELQNNPAVISIEPDAIVKVEEQSEGWGVDSIIAPSAWNLDYTGRGVKIALLDTGVADHSDIDIAGGISFVNYTTSYADDNGHGTHVAGIIGANNNDIGTVGIAYDADLYSVKVMDNKGNGYISDVIKGIDWAITNKMDIINLSFGTDVSDPSLEEIVKKAYNSGLIIVAASGNKGNAEGSGDNVGYPARYDPVIAVAATDSNNNRAFFSATGSEIDVSAPGVSITSTYLNDSYQVFSGTSMAAPFVSGYLALLKQAYPAMSNDQLRAIMQENAIDLGDPGRDDKYGYGMIQVKEFAPAYTVSFDTLGGTSISSVSALQNTTVTAPQEPVKEGYIFDGWYQDSSGMSAWNFDTNVITGNTIIYAKWVAYPEPPVEVKAVSSKYNTIKIEWNKVDGAVGYQLFKAQYPNGSYELVTKTTSTAWSNGSLTVGKTYYYKVRSYILVGSKKYYGEFSSVASAKTVPSVPKKFTAAAGLGKVKLSWSTVPGAGGYKIYRATSLNGTYRLVKAATSASWTNEGLTTGKTYYYKVRAYCMSGSKIVYGAYTEVKSVKVK